MVKDTLNFLSNGFAHPAYLGLLLVIPAVLFGGWRANRRRRRAVKVWLGGLGPSIFDKTRPLSGRRWLTSLCQVSGLALLIVGSAGPQWGRDPAAPPALGRDILAVLDVSRSMLAEDRSPNRLERAKRHVRDLIDTLQRHGDYRVGLIAFAGKAKVLCPLTEDYDHFRFALELAHPDRLGPAGRVDYHDDGTSFGTSLRAALELAATMNDVRFRGYEHLVLITDGDDLAGDWQSGMRQVRRTGMAVHVLGVGDSRPVRIPTGRLDEPFVRYQDENHVWHDAETQRNEDLLRELAEAVGGTYQAEESLGRPLVHWFEENVSPLPSRELTEDEQPFLLQRYGWFFGAALVLLTLSLLTANRPLAAE